MDSADDTIRRFVVHFFTYDPDRRERRPVEVGCFDNEADSARFIFAMVSDPRSVATTDGA